MRNTKQTLAADIENETIDQLNMRRPDMLVPCACGIMGATMPVIR